jgi:hypothetical protein
MVPISWSSLNQLSCLPFALSVIILSEETVAKELTTA